jgi:hypothetical protein
MGDLSATVENCGVVIEIGGFPVSVRSADADFLNLLQNRYSGFIGRTEPGGYEFDVNLIPPGAMAADDDLRVRQHSGRWSAERGDFRAEWNSTSNKGDIRQSANPYSIDAVLRIVHSLVLSKEGGFLLHAASAIRNGRAFLFAGVSGAGKTTMARLAPTDAALLTDEISYVRKHKDGYFAFGTPFTGELAKSGENICAPIAGLYLLAQGPQNRLEPVVHAEAVRALLTNILFFAEETELVEMVFHSACEFISRIPVYRLTFVPDPQVWELIV